MTELAVGEDRPIRLDRRETLLYIKALSDSLREMAVGLEQSHLARLLADASEEAARLAEPH